MEGQEIEYKGKRFKTRDILVIFEDGGDPVRIRIAPQSLQDAMEDKYNDPETPEAWIDGGIYFYVADADFELSDELIAAEHLDTPLKVYKA